MLELATVATLASVPLGGAVVGWGTNLLAIRMLFAPLQRRGLGPLAWQGVIPARAEQMAASCADLLLGRLVTEQELYDRLDPAGVAAVLEGPLLAAIEAVIQDRLPRLWPRLPAALRGRVMARVRPELRAVVAEVLADLRRDLPRHLDVRGLIVDTFQRDRALLGELFWRCGERELRFVISSGLAFGLLLGLGQLAAFAALPSPWLLAALGAAIGGATNWLALQMIFAPVEPVVCGRWRLQGLFLRRQPQVSAAYANFFATRVITPERLVRQVLAGPASDQLLEGAGRRVEAAVERCLGASRPWVARALGPEEFAATRRALADAALGALDPAVPDLTARVGRELDLERTLSERLRSLPPADFAGVLRPIFQADEWVLTAIGAALGLAAGLAQAWLCAA